MQRLQALPPPLLIHSCIDSFIHSSDDSGEWRAADGNEGKQASKSVLCRHHSSSLSVVCSVSIVTRLTTTVTIIYRAASSSSSEEEDYCDPEPPTPRNSQSYSHVEKREGGQQNIHIRPTSLVWLVPYLLARSVPALKHLVTQVGLCKQQGTAPLPSCRQRHHHVLYIHAQRPSLTCCPFLLSRVSQNSCAVLQSNGKDNKRQGETARSAVVCMLIKRAVCPRVVAM
ncbi:hypothetical protein IWZ03DRAFT_138358 [Phyllosticta citriasiana]|uniref:Uncharacterized protein n=1 Tax=Phyllosticta citriasiana TaxID=595635 RepID=A0ABR1KSC6_9PEZI